MIGSASDSAGSSGEDAAVAGDHTDSSRDGDIGRWVVGGAVMTLTAAALIKVLQYTW